MTLSVLEQKETWGRRFGWDILTQEDMFLEYDGMSIGATSWVAQYMSPGVEGTQVLLWEAGAVQNGIILFGDNTFVKFTAEFMPMSKRIKVLFRYVEQFEPRSEFGLAWLIGAPETIPETNYTMCQIYSDEHWSHKLISMLKTINCQESIKQIARFARKTSVYYGDESSLTSISVTSHEYNPYRFFYEVTITGRVVEAHKPIDPEPVAQSKVPVLEAIEKYSDIVTILTTTGSAEISYGWLMDLHRKISELKAMADQ